MSSERKIAANRANAQKSTGPKTPEGKAKVACNALKHGLCSAAVVLPSESEEAYDELQAAYVERFQPADPVETSLVEHLAARDWRMRRAFTLESSLVSQTIEDDREWVDSRYDDATPKLRAPSPTAVPPAPAS